MSAAFVLDCSMTMAWAFADERTTETEAIRQRARQETVCVPVHWYLEVCNAMVSAVKRKRIAENEARALLQTFASIRRVVDSAHVFTGFEIVFDAARRHNLTSYDAAYLELAHRRKLPLASLDDPLRAAATSLGIPVLGK